MNSGERSTYMPVEAEATSSEQPGTSPRNADGDVVQFSTEAFYVDEDEKGLEIQLMRLGPLEGEVSVQYETCDRTAKAGETYEEAHGRITFAHGEHAKSLQLNLVPNRCWKSTLEFIVKLSEPQNCQLGLNLKSCTVKVLDRSVFPSEALQRQLSGVHYKDQLRTQVEEIGHHQLFWEFWKFSFFHADVQGSTVLVIFMDQLKNLYHLLTIYVLVYLVNVVLNTRAAGGRGGTENDLLLEGRAANLYLCGSLHVLPLFVLHFWDHSRMKIHLHGRVEAFLRVNLVRKYINFAPMTRASIDPGIIDLALHTDAEKLANGYQELLSLLEIVGKLTMSFIFAFQKARSALWILVLLPSISVVWTLCREKGFFRVKGGTGPLSKMINALQDIISKYHLFDSYSKRAVAVDIIEEQALKVCDAGIPKKLYELHSEYFLRWVSQILVAVFIVKEGFNVLSGETSLGAFLGAIRILHNISEGCLDAYQKYVAVLLTIKPLQKFTVLLNCQTDLEEKKDANRKRRTQSEATYKNLGSKLSADKAAASLCKDDLATIELRDVCFEVTPHGASDLGSQCILHNCSGTLEQGTIVAMTGMPRSGKQSLMKMMTMKIFPSSGSVFVPGHLKVLFVSQEPVLLRLSAYQNLIFGLPPGRLPDHDRISKILQILQMVDTIRITKDELNEPSKGDFDCLVKKEVNDWQESISRTEACLFHLARALITNPEVLLLEKPFRNYSSALESVIISCLYDHVQNRGLCMPPLRPVHTHHRRPRTLVFSTVELSKEQATIVDVIWELKRSAEGSTVFSTSFGQRTLS